MSYEEIPLDVELSHEASYLKKWIKIISFNENILFENYPRKQYFKYVADIVLDKSEKRSTTIRFDPVIPKDEFDKKVEWLYLFLINDHIVKIGGTRNGLKGRVSSYLCGHHTIERNKSGDCSKTNAFIYNTFNFYLELGYTVKMYGYELPKIIHNTQILDKNLSIHIQTYHAYESSFLDDFKKTYGKYPALSDNCDPDYKNR